MVVVVVIERLPDALAVFVSFSSRILIAITRTDRNLSSHVTMMDVSLFLLLVINSWFDKLLCLYFLYIVY